MECGWTSICLKDLISYLPDGILVSILSRLEIEQAARTSALARRWRYLWTFTSSLIFKFCDWRIVDHEDKLFGLKCRQFVDWVNHILKFHRDVTREVLEYILFVCPLLEELSILHSRSLNFIQVSSYLLQLETLELNLSWGLKKLRYFPRFPKLRNLRQLELMLNPGVSMLLCAYLLRASPLLRMLKIEFWDFKDSTKETKIRRPKHLHKSLKVLELNGFIGCKADLQIASYILGSTVSLQEIIIDPSHPNKWAPEDPDTQQLARMRARQHLETRLPFGTQLVLR
ncbi:putative F-box/LRR-repeat protein At3g58880 isoform X8 [Camellia sinensis]|uniref:putative F-box/LRR-repeat protein At3g58880 isoform X8 n=1 Tax=Camellia sinensis TaxID=4442 RepID=UPI0010355D72|nr:putative F-box/LRR-repeat protein At3g58880 isoform X8 [Camellia sinensis]